MTDHQAITLLRALRGNMRPWGLPPPANPHQTDEHEQAEHQYRVSTNKAYSGPLPGLCALTLNGETIPYHWIYQRLIAAQELDRQERKRTPAAKALTFTLHAETFYPHYAIAAKTALLGLI